MADERRTCGGIIVIIIRPAMSGRDGFDRF